MLSWLLKIRKSILWLIKLANWETKIVKKWEILKQKTPLNKILSMIWSPVTKEKLRNLEDKFMNSKVRWATDKPKPILRSIWWDKTWKVKSRPMKCSRPETSFCSSGVTTLKGTSNLKESATLTFCRIRTSPEERQFRFENRSELSFKPSRTKKLSRSEIFSNLRRTDWSLTCSIRSTNSERKRRSLPDCWPSTRNSRTR